MSSELNDKFSNSQWNVTPDGLECAGYFIDKARLRETRDGLYEWPCQVCTKNWVDFDGFVAAFEAALEFHLGGYDDALMRATIVKCRRRIAECAEFDAVCRDLFPERFTGGIHGFFVSDFDAVNEEIKRRRAAKAA